MHRSEYMRNADNINPAIREDYHRRYYGQYVDETIILLVVQMLGKARIKASTALYFGDIPFQTWDNMVYCLSNNIVDALKENGDTFSICAGICILKEAAQQIKESI